MRMTDTPDILELVGTTCHLLQSFFMEFDYTRLNFEGLADDSLSIKEMEALLLSGSSYTYMNLFKDLLEEFYSTVIEQINDW